MSTQHVYIIGSKSIGQYGGFESFVMNLLMHHVQDAAIQYHVACKANGSGCMDISRLPGAEADGEDSFSFCGAHCFMIPIPERFGAAQAIYYDLKALKYVCDHIEHNHIENPVVYILASRIGPFERRYVHRIHRAGGYVYQNPDGHEDRRGKWNRFIRRYWKLSEKHAVKMADLVVCDSRNIEKYICEEYSDFSPSTVFIAYGTDEYAEASDETRARYGKWLEDNNLKDGEFFVSVGRFVPENNYETMIREFMKSHTARDYVIITTKDEAYAARLKETLDYERDSRIKFVDAVYDRELLTLIRRRAFAYMHGHEVGGTNPSLLESMATTDLNLLLDVGFNREVAEDTAYYWNKSEGDLSALIDRADAMDVEERGKLGNAARLRMKTEYSWDKICGSYAKIFKDHSLIR